eukprot:TRINITY_DN3141_c0_g2_i8.p1 TRINITY_DN3141_c0_g2~~TRINITY_DN3141_c0_g2_i8.p1  ORF type:complete len:579 (-),score=159.18 TRINITY_DN3141_c0_g2_i8:252-1988(-)
MLLDIPRDIAGSLNSVTDLGALSQVNRTCHLLLNDDFWQRRVKREFGIKSTNKTWKVQYQLCYEQRVIPTRITTAIRCRPTTSREASESVAKLEVQSQTVCINDQSFSFDHCFDSNANQEDIFTSLCLPLVKGFLNGINGAMYAWGPTGSGKTHTISGTDGMIHRSLQHMFDHGKEMELYISFITIQNERVRDYLKEDLDQNGYPHRIREANGIIYIENLEKNQIFNLNDAVFNLKNGQERWHRNSTMMSDLPSRHWHIVTIWMEHHVTVPMGKKYYSARLDFIDCAGSQRITRQGASSVREAASINRSTTTFANVIQALIHRPCHVPYRDSKVTRILQHSLGNNCQTVMLGTMSPMECDVAESVSTLRFLSRCKVVINSVRKNVQLDDEIDRHGSINAMRQWDPPPSGLGIKIEDVLSRLQTKDGTWSDEMKAAMDQLCHEGLIGYGYNIESQKIIFWAKKDIRELILRKITPLEIVMRLRLPDEPPLPMRNLKVEDLRLTYAIRPLMPPGTPCGFSFYTDRQMYWFVAHPHPKMVYEWYWDLLDIFEIRIGNEDEVRTNVKDNSNALPITMGMTNH